MTGPDHRYEAYVIRIAPNAETKAESETYKSTNRHVVNVTVGFSAAVQKDYLARNQTDEMRPGAEVRADRVRHDKPGLLSAPQADSGVLRISAVPLAVLAVNGPRTCFGRLDFNGGDFDLKNRAHPATPWKRGGSSDHVYLETDRGTGRGLFAARRRGRTGPGWWVCRRPEVAVPRPSSSKSWRGSTGSTSLTWPHCERV